MKNESSLSRHVVWCLGLAALGLCALGFATPTLAQESIVVNCSSGQGRRSICDLGAPIQEARVERKISAAACNQGSSWGFSGTAIWVDRGCRADFRVLLVDLDFPPLPPPQQVYCASGGMRRQVCNIPDTFVTGLDVARQDSRSACVLGKSYGFTENSVWVDKGCRALFNIYGLSQGFPVIEDFNQVEIEE